jgi:hypothetical protein
MVGSSELHERSVSDHDFFAQFQSAELFVCDQIIQASGGDGKDKRSRAAVVKQFLDNSWFGHLGFLYWGYGARGQAQQKVMPCRVG